MAFLENAHKQTNEIWNDHTIKTSHVCIFLKIQMNLLLYGGEPASRLYATRSRCEQAHLCEFGKHFC